MKSIACNEFQMVSLRNDGVFQLQNGASCLASRFCVGLLLSMQTSRKSSDFCRPKAVAQLDRVIYCERFRPLDLRPSMALLRQ